MAVKYIRNANLSFEAKGLLAIVLSNNEFRHFDITTACKWLQVERPRMLELLKELEENRYCHSFVMKNNNGVYERIYQFCESIVLYH